MLSSILPCHDAVGCLRRRTGDISWDEWKEALRDEGDEGVLRECFEQMDADGDGRSGCLTCTGAFALTLTCTGACVSRARMLHGCLCSPVLPCCIELAAFALPRQADASCATMRAHTRTRARPAGYTDTPCTRLTQAEFNAGLARLHFIKS
jgi:hypothetical protein